jgi:hypothetical protein
LAIANNEAAGFEYQTYGAWLTGFNTGSGNVGVGSFGAKTASSAMPTGTTATYNGASTGFINYADGVPGRTTSKVTVSTDFSTATISSSSSLVTFVDAIGGTDQDHRLDFTGTGPVSGSGFTATVDSDFPAPVSGSVDGQFYGPSAQEVGGTFGLTGSGVDYIGSFGGKK